MKRRLPQKSERNVAYEDKTKRQKFRRGIVQVAIVIFQFNFRVVKLFFLGDSAWCLCEVGQHGRLSLAATDSCAFSAGGWMFFRHGRGG